MVDRAELGRAEEGAEAGTGTGTSKVGAVGKVAADLEALEPLAMSFPERHLESGGWLLTGFGFQSAYSPSSH